MAPDPERESDPAAERRDRLRALRAAAELAVNPDVEQPEEEEDEHDGVVVDGEPQQQEQVVSFRNYLPRDEDLQQNKKTPVQLAKFEDPVTRTDVDERRQEDPIVSIAPKKPNWDLRRDVAKKLEKLERRTQRAIVELMQEEEKMRQVANERRDEVIDAEQ